MIVYTVAPSIFAFGGTHEFLKTEIDEYERINIGKGYYGILFYNDMRNIYHICEETSGTLIGTYRDKFILIGNIKSDVETGDTAIMIEQVKQGMENKERAKMLDKSEWFNRFDGKGDVE